MHKNAKIYVAGHKGLVGSAILRKLESLGYTNLIYKTKSELDLTNELQTASFFSEQKPEYVFLAAAKVGGIIANRDYPAEFIYENLKIQNNVIHYSYLNKVKKLCFLGSTCIYPKLAPQPLKEEYLLTGPLEETNEAYAVAKIAGIKMCQAYNKQYGTNFISVMPTNLYGPNDNFDLTTSHVLPAFIRRFHEAKTNNAKEVVIWGTGTPRREFLYVDDLAEALIFLMENYEDSEIINIGVGEDIPIIDLAKLVARIVGYNGEIKTDTSKPDGTPRKLVDVSKITSMGWRPKTSLEEGIKLTYEWYLQNYN
ncbi:MAG: GDP-L-fucose synthase [candidate division WOR-3 bacterium]